MMTYRVRAAGLLVAPSPMTAVGVDNTQPTRRLGSVCPMTARASARAWSHLAEVSLTSRISPARQASGRRHQRSGMYCSGG